MVLVVIEDVLWVPGWDLGVNEEVLVVIKEVLGEL